MSLYADFMGAVDKAIATRDSCPGGRTGTHQSHDLADGRHCPGHIEPTTLPADQTARLADAVRAEIHR